LYLPVQAVAGIIWVENTIIVTFGFYYPIKFLCQVYGMTDVDAETEANGCIACKRAGIGALFTLTSTLYLTAFTVHMFL
jgi:hypothetical protein